MSNNDDFRGFSHLAEAYYASSALSGQDYDDEIMIGIYCRSGGTKGEFAIRWEQLGRVGKFPYLRVWNDAWGILAEFKDLLHEMAKLDRQRIEPMAFCELLKRLGIEDATKRKRD